MERRRKKLVGRGKGGFTLIELLMVVAIIGILAAIAMPIYANMQAKARSGKAQSDVATIAEALSAFAAHCGDVPATVAAAAWPGTGVANGSACTGAVNGGGGVGVAPLTSAVTDANTVSSGPWFSTSPTPPQGWNYRMTRSGTANFQVIANDGTADRFTAP